MQTSYTQQISIFKEELSEMIYQHYGILIPKYAKISINNIDNSTLQFSWNKDERSVKSKSNGDPS